MSVCTGASSSSEIKGPVPYVPGEARVRSGSSSSVGSTETLVESDGAVHKGKQVVLMGEGAAPGVEGFIDTSTTSESACGELVQSVVGNLNKIVGPCDITIDMALHEDLQKKLQIASGTFEHCYKAVYTSWAKKLLLSPKLRSELKKDLEQAGRFIHCLQQICDDALFLQKKIEWIQKPTLSYFSNDSEIQESDVLPENSANILAEQCEIYIAWHVQNLTFVEQCLAQYITETQHFLALPENAPPKQDAVDRLSSMLIPLPGLIGGVVTVLTCVLGTTAAFAFIPLGVGILGTCITAAIYTKDLLKLIPAEKKRQLIEEREELMKSFPPVLDLLQRAIHMFRGTPPTTSGVPPAQFDQAFQELKRQNQDLINIMREEKTVEVKAMTVLVNEIKAIRSGQDGLVRDVAPLLGRTRTTSTHSNDSGIGRSRPDTPVAGKVKELSTLSMEQLEEKLLAEAISFQVVLEEISVLDKGQIEQIKFHLTSTREIDYRTALDHLIRTLKNENKLNAEQGLQILLELPSKGFSYWNVLQELKSRLITAKYSDERINRMINTQIDNSKESPSAPNMA